MNAGNAHMHDPCSPEQIDEAAVWMTLLRGPERSEQTERGFRRWLSADAAHAAAFERVSTAWETTAALPRGPFPHLSRWQRTGFRAGFLGAASAVAVAAVVAVVAFFYFSRAAGVTTGIGEQRILALEDGSRVFLNTDTQLVVNYNSQLRSIELKRGEALFEVAHKTADRPFVVTVDGKRITALGTSFLVRRDDQRLSVVLLEGRVAVGAAAALATTMTPGQRLVFARDGAPQIDRPPLEKVTAWRDGHVDFDETPLADAIAEMNRYSPLKLRVEQPEAAHIPITGIFRAGAAASFATAVAEAYRLKVIENPKEILLSGTPSPEARLRAGAIVLHPN